MIYFVCYDITDNRLRKKVSDRLIRIGLTRIQYSVFIGTIKDHLQEDLVSWLNMKFVHPFEKGERRNILIFNMTERQLSNKINFGKRTFSDEEITGKLNTLYIG